MPTSTAHANRTHTHAHVYTNRLYTFLYTRAGFTFVNAQEGLAPNGKFRDSFLSHEEVKTYAVNIATPRHGMLTADLKG